MKDLAHRHAETGIPITTWTDDEMVFIQYGCATISMPIEDFVTYASTIDESADKLGTKL